MKFAYVLGGDEGGEEKPQRVVYIPPAPPEEEEEIFKTIQQGINFDNYDNISVEMTGRDPVVPISTFQETALYDTFKSNVEKAKYVKPTPVQKYSIPAILAGRDLMACAQTGSGKTVSIGKQSSSTISLCQVIPSGIRGTKQLNGLNKKFRQNFLFSNDFK